jgi:hypothetical protein
VPASASGQPLPSCSYLLRACLRPCCMLKPSLDSAGSSSQQPAIDENFSRVAMEPASSCLEICLQHAADHCTHAAPLLINALEVTRTQCRRSLAGL